MRTGDHFYPMKLVISNDSVTATGGAHSYQDGPGAVRWDDGCDITMRREDFPCTLGWNYFYESPDRMRNKISSIEERRFETFEDFVGALER